MGCKPSPYATKVGPPGWRSSEKPRGSPTVQLRGVTGERSKGNKRGQTRGLEGPEDGAATLLNELEQLDHDLIQRNPSAALDACLHAIRVAESRPLITGVRLCGCQFEAIFSRVVGIVYDHRGGDIQIIVDALYDAWNTFSSFPRTQKKCLGYLYKICGENNLLPMSMQIQLPRHIADTPHCRGGFADVLKCGDGGREVAVKVLRIYSDSDLRKLARKFCKEVITWKALDHPNVVPLLGVPKDRSQLRFAMVSEWMANGNINQFVKAHRDANRFKLLGDAARGLNYMHAWGMVHGDLKGGNILVDQTGNARLTDFGLLMMVQSDLTTSSSFGQAGSSRWMSPELLDPEKFGFKDSRRTKSSDCYALGMAIYEVLSGQAPFAQQNKYAAVGKVLQGERPGRPQGAEEKWFTDDVWSILGRCWEHNPGDRPNIEDVLWCLEEASRVWVPPSRPTETTPPPADSPPWSLSDLSTDGSRGGRASAKRSRR